MADLGAGGVLPARGACSHRIRFRACSNKWFRARCRAGARSGRRTAKASGRAPKTARARKRILHERRSLDRGTCPIRPKGNSRSGGSDLCDASDGRLVIGCRGWAVASICPVHSKGDRWLGVVDARGAPTRAMVESTQGPLVESGTVDDSSRAVTGARIPPARSFGSATRGLGGPPTRARTCPARVCQIFRV